MKVTNIFKGQFDSFSFARSAQKPELPAGQLAFLNPARYTRDVLRHFGDDMTGLHKHVMTARSDEEKRLILDNSADYRKFLGVYPTRLDKLMERASTKRSSSTSIPDHEAPEALAMAATQFTSTKGQLRALQGLEKALHDAPLNKAPGPEGMAYRQSVEKAFVGLISNLGALKSDESKRLAVYIVTKGKTFLGTSAQVRISEGARRAKDISNDPQVKHLLRNLITVPQANNQGRNSLRRKFDDENNNTVKRNISNREEKKLPPLPPRNSSDQKEKELPAIPRLSLDNRAADRNISNLKDKELAPTLLEVNSNNGIVDRQIGKNGPRPEPTPRIPKGSSNTPNPHYTPRLNLHRPSGTPPPVPSRHDEPIGLALKWTLPHQPIVTKSKTPPPPPPPPRREKRDSEDRNSMIGLGSAEWMRQLEVDNRKAPSPPKDDPKQRPFVQKNDSGFANSSFDETTKAAPELNNRFADTLSSEPEHISAPDRSLGDETRNTASPKHKPDRINDEEIEERFISELEQMSAPDRSLGDETRNTASPKHKPDRINDEEIEERFISELEQMSAPDRSLGDETRNTASPKHKPDRINDEVTPPSSGPFAERDVQQVFSELCEKHATQPDRGRQYFEGLRRDIVGFLDAHQMNLPRFGRQWTDYLDLAHSGDLGSIDGSSTANLKKLLGVVHNHIQTSKAPQEVLEDLTKEGLKTRQLQTMRQDFAQCAFTLRSGSAAVKLDNALRPLNEKYSVAIGRMDASTQERLEKSAERLEALAETMAQEIKARHDHPTARISKERLEFMISEFNMPPEARIAHLRSSHWNDDHLSDLKKLIDACRVSGARELAVEEFNDTYGNLLPMEEKTLEGYKALSDAIGLDLARKRSPEQWLAALKAGDAGWGDDALNTLKQAIDACGNAQEFEQAAQAFNGNWLFDELPRMAPDTLHVYQALSHAIRRDLDFRNPSEVINKLKSSGWQDHDIFRLKEVIDHCNHQHALLAAEATKYFNGNYTGAVLPAMSDETREGYKTLSSAIPLSLALGRDAKAPLHTATNDELMGQLQPHPYFRVNDGIWAAMAITLDRCMHVHGPDDTPDMIAQAQGDTAQAIMDYNNYYKWILGADIADLHQNLNYANALEKRTDPPLTQWEKDYCATIQARADKVGLLARDMKAYGLEKTAAPQQSKTEQSNSALWAVPAFNREHKIDFADPKYGTGPQWNADAVIKELERGGFEFEHLKALKLDIQRIRDDREGQQNLGPTGFDERYANVFAFDAQNEQTRLGKLTAALIRYLKTYPA
jgi:hypothetical protein